MSGVHRHVEVDGNEFPFSRGASFYEVNSNGQIVYGRDLVEPALKPGSSALLVRYIAPFVGRLPGRRYRYYYQYMVFRSGGMAPTSLSLVDSPDPSSSFQGIQMGQSFMGLSASDSVTQGIAL